MQFIVRNDNKITQLSNSLPGTYACVASTSQGTDTKTGELTVEGIPPKIIVEPSDRVGFELHSRARQGERGMGVAFCAFSYRFFVSFQIVTEGTRIVLPCTATGVPEPKHVWFNVSFFLAYSSLFLTRMEMLYVLFERCVIDVISPWHLRVETSHFLAILPPYY